MILWEACFWASALTIAYVYAGYPLLLYLAAWVLRPQEIRRRDIEPTVSLIVAAHNEEKVIRAKLENTLRLDYPRERLEILVASDGSTDRTESIVREFEGQGVDLIALGQRRGKSSAQDAAAVRARGSILMFSDANAFLDPDAVRKLVRNFADPRVGAVSGRQVLVQCHETGVGRGESLYWRYENMLRRLESRLGCCIAANGCIFALRRELYSGLGPGDSEDFVLPLQVALRGLRVAFEPEAVAQEKAVAKVGDEFRMRLRTAHADSRSLLRLGGRILRCRPWLAFQCLSHKLLRWSVAAFAAGALVSSVFLLHLPFYRSLFVLQLLFYAAAACGFALEASRVRIPFFYVPYFFSLANTAVLMGLARGAVGVPWTQVWEKAETTR